MAPISIRVAGVSFSGRSDNIRKLLNDKRRLFVQCRLIHEQNNERDSQAVSVVTRIGDFDMSYLARGALPFDAKFVNGQIVRLELGQCKSGVFTPGVPCFRGLASKQFTFVFSFKN